MSKILFKRILQKTMLTLFWCIILQLDVLAFKNGNEVPFSIADKSVINRADVTGVVKDDKGLPLPGVGVKVKGTQQGVSTDAEGKFILKNVPSNAVIVFTSIGFKEKEVLFDGKSVINVTLEEDAKGLSEVVVVGYGTQKKVNLTGAVTAISGEDLRNRPVPNVTAALQGQVPGVVVTRSGGQPGKEGYNLRIRGTNSINGTGALVLVDGIQMDLNLINPDDVESISFLKDAAASAIYGARAAGGVVLVTTKSSTSGKTKINFNSFYSFNITARQPERLNSWDEQTLIDEARFNATGAREFTPEQIEWLKNPNFNYRPNLTSNRWEYFDNTDWIKAGMSTVNHSQNHSLSVGGGTKELNYLLSGGFQNSDGVLRYGPDDNSRYNLKLNLNTQINKYIDASFVVGYIGQITNSNSFSTGQIVNALYRVRTRQSLYTPAEDTTGQPYNGDLQVNPVDIEKNAGFTREMYESMTGKIDLKFKNFIKGLQINTVAWRNQDNFNYEQNRRSLYWYGRSNTEAPRFTANVPNGITVIKNRGYYDNLQTTVDYDLKVAEKHNFKVMGGASYEQYRKDEVNAAANGLYSNDTFSLNFAEPLNKLASDNVETYAFASLFGRFNYNYAEKYLFESTFRYDGSSRLDPKARWTFFPSLSAGWRISEESFIKNNIKPISNLKIRASWGRVGNAVGSGIGNYDYITVLESANNLVLNGARANYFYQNRLPSPGKTWETVQSANIGLDFGLFKERLSGALEFYRNKNINMYVDVNLPGIVGVQPSKINGGTLENWGWETNVRWRDKLGAVGYSVGLNFSDNQNKLIDFNGARLIGTGGLMNAIEGFPLNTIWGYKTGGIFQTDAEAAAYTAQAKYPFFATPKAGDIKYLDLNGDGIIDAGKGTPEAPGDLVYLGNTSARYSYGFDIGLNWKGFDFLAAFQGTLKRSFLIATETLSPLNGTANMPWSIHMDRWTPDNPNAFFPRMYQTSDHNYRPSDRWVQNGSYIRLKNLQVGYNVPIKKKYLQNVRVYFSGQDLWESTKVMSVFDPEVPNGVNSQAYPFYRAYAFGLNVTF
ncbi:SusC/RagA family TonB-linked outer membrane protein [Pedobacter xixiisoli]|uniref:TonB-linked outer membrane protein, SusC/RagA family n=1 Tax=Pedobacter xixiisoli TaxID=1476464 RepID=A0A285ZRR9_9SPHI|nr:TonB-dependent receptor [Pedobacter xixiisoli]SOD12353.1 TonB-linked outer membrane protein, SusC/RagA family [Pedobacter xixiisoli]